MENLTPTGRILAWTALALGSGLFVIYLPSVFGVVTKYDVRTSFLPLFVVSFASGICYARRRRRLAFGVVVVMLLGVVLLDIDAIWPVLGRRP